LCGFAPYPWQALKARDELLQQWREASGHAASER
jgi:ribosome modulation factor